MEVVELLRELMVLLAVSLPVVFLFHRLGIPPLVGFLVAGLLMGPSATGIIASTETAHVLAEIGVILLLFTIGLEVAIGELSRLRRVVLGAGSLQVLITTGVTAAAAAGLVRLPLGEAMVLGFLFALSSTAIVLKTLADRGELDSPHGRVTLGVLLFQDLCVLPVMMLLPLVGGPGDIDPVAIGLVLGKALLALALFFSAARIVFPAVMRRVARLRIRELFVGVVALFCIGTVWLLAQVGVSLAIGAFVAGLVVSDSEFNAQVTAEVLPLRDLLSSVFFVSVGMLLDLGGVAGQLPLVLGLVAGVLVVKFVLASLVVLPFVRAPRVAAVVGLCLAQLGEFSFVVGREAVERGALQPDTFQVVLAVSVLTMLVGPSLIAAAPGLAMGVFGGGTALPPPDEVVPAGHVVLIGYGLNGRNLARVLREVGIPYRILDLNPDAVRRAALEGEPVFFGDATRTNVLEHVAVSRAAVVVVAISDRMAAQRVVRLARELNRSAAILVRTRFVSEVEGLLGLGADEVIPEELETSVEIFARVLQRMSVPRNVIDLQVDLIRAESYAMLRDLKLPQLLDELRAVLELSTTRTYLLLHGSPAVGGSLKDLNLRGASGATVIAVVRQGKSFTNPSPVFVFAEGDVLVLFGSHAELVAAARLLDPAPRPAGHGSRVGSGGERPAGLQQGESAETGQMVRSIRNNPRHGRRGADATMKGGRRGAPLARALLAGALATTLGAGAVPAESFVNFESGHVRPLALSPDGGLLFAVNTPDNRLSVFRVGEEGLVEVAEVPVGLEPVAVAARVNARGALEAWVVNHLSDSVSVVEVDADDPSRSQVTRTLWVGDEPRDLVIAGPGRDRVFVTAARRGQNHPDPADPSTAGIGRADVWVFDADSPGSGAGGTPLTIIALFADTPRALAASPDGRTVYAAAFHSGNRTTAVTERVVTSGGGLPPAPAGAPAGAPDTGLIVKFDAASGAWQDEIGRDWGDAVMFDLPDDDVFRIAADADPPVAVEGISGVGTILFNMAVHPASGRVYVANLESRNHVRFEGIVNEFQGVKGHIAESRITVIDGTTVTPAHLNAHIDYLTVPGPADEREESLAFPLGMAFSDDGGKLYVAGFGSEKIGVLDAEALAGGAVSGELIEVGGGPTGLVLDGQRDRLYVMSRFAHRVVTVSSPGDPSRRAVTGSVPVGFDPSPPEVRHGRRFLYDARRLSAHGDSACASCHVFGDLDSLAWDLGDPTGSVQANRNPFRLGSGSPFHPLKGPMTTQSLRGMADAGPMHWRGDRTGGTAGGDPLDEDLAFKTFNVAFEGLLGRESQLTDAEMQAFTDFVLTLRYPPNPIRALDDEPTATEAAGEEFFTTEPVDGGKRCMDCHALPLGTDGFSSIEGEPQEFKIPHLRNVYQKVGMFGVPAGALAGVETGFLGDQVRGFGILHDGSVATVFDFLHASVFSFDRRSGDEDRRNLEAFVLAFDTGLKPIVGQQVSVTSVPAAADVRERLDLLSERAAAGDCDLVVKARVNGEDRGALFAGDDGFRTDRAGDPPLGKATLLGLAGGTNGGQVYTCVPPGSGTRVGIDRDEDGFFDRDETDAGTNPADAASFPGGAETVTIGSGVLQMKDASTRPGGATGRKFTFKTSTDGDAAEHRIVVPALDSAGDPAIHGATLRIYNSNGSGEQITVELPAAKWSGSAGRGFAFKSSGSSDPVRSVDVRDDRIKIKGGGAGWLYTLDEPAQGRIVVRLTLGSQIEWCTEALPASSGNPPSTASNDRVDRFKARKKSPAPDLCPPPPAG